MTVIEYRDRRALRILISRLNGKNKKQVATHFHLSTRTVEAITDNFRKKFLANDLIHLAGILIKQGILYKESLESDPVLPDILCKDMAGVNIIRSPHKPPKI